MRIWEEYDWDMWKPKEEPVPEETDNYRKISICTTCMNRLHDLMITLPVNLYHNQEYPFVEFVLLDYNSQDGLEDWVRRYMMDHIKSGRLVYAKTTEPKHYAMSHSRNVAMKIASGDIVNSVDADNFTGPGFIDLINRLAEIQPKKAAFVKGKRMMHGRIGFYKKEWLALGGYDEDLYSYGFDDHNLLYRAMANDCKLMWWGHFGKRYSERIRTPHSKKMSNMEHKNRKWCEEENRRITMEKLERNELVVNQDRHWGKAHVTINFERELDL